MIFASILTLLAFAATASGNLAGSTFDGGDGNLVVNDEAKDWANIGIVCETAGCAIDEPTGSSDDSFGEGTSENDDPPSVVDGSIPNNKSDLTRFYVANEKVGSPANDLLYLAWERVQEPSGTTNMDFEFNQGSALSSNGVTPTRLQGDLLIKYDLSQGGTNPTLGFHRWQTQAANPSATTPSARGAICEAGNKFPCWGKVQSLAGNFEGAVNTDTVIDPINPDAPRSLSPRTFGEAAINLTNSGLFPAGQCTSFGSGYLKSRSSDSFTAAIKDFIAPIDVNVSNCGSITIKKETDPQLAASSPDFPFTVTGGASPNSFNLKDDGSRAYTGLLAGSYTFTEGDLPSGWEFDRIECTADGSTITEDEANKKVTIGLVADTDPVCTFYNRKKPQLTVIKKIVGGNGTTDSFDVKVDGTTKINDATSTAAAGTSVGPFDVSTGSHTVSETLGDGTTAVPTSDWTIAFSGDCDASGSVSVTYGESKSCTITNTKKAMLTVNKVCVPSDDGGKFDLRIDGAVAGTGDDAACGGTTGAVVVSVGAHTVSEAAGAGGTNLADYVTVISGACAADGSVTLAAGESKTCTITNTRRKFTVVAFVCETTSGTPALYKSSVTLPYPDGTSKTTATAVLSGTTATAMCGLAANYPNLNTGNHDARVSIGVTPAP